MKKDETSAINIRKVNSNSATALDLKRLADVYMSFIVRTYGNLKRPDFRRVLITGAPGSGKTTFLNTFINTAEQLAKENGDPELVFIDFTAQTYKELAVTRSDLLEVFTKIAEQLETELSQIVLVAKTPEVAMSVAEVLGERVSIILECDKSVIKGGTWSGWNVLDIDSVELSRKQMNTVLSVYKDYVEQITKKRPTNNEIVKFLDLLLEAHPVLVQENRFVVPPGYVCSTFFDVYSQYTFAIKRRGYPSGGPDLFVEAFDFINQSASGDLVNLCNDIEESNGVLEAIMGPEAIRLTPSKEAESDKTKIKNEPFVKPQFNLISTLRDDLEQHILGQKEAVDAVCSHMKIASAFPDVKDYKKPIASFIFLGPTGVGKTEMALQLARSVFDKEMNVLRLDMSEFSQDHEVAKLFGSPPGYVGHEEGGILSRTVKENPYTLILLDEVEKAHPKTFDTFLQILDYGFLRDSSGEAISFENTILVMTSNIGTRVGARPGFGNDGVAEKKVLARTETLKEMKKFFRMEFINRIDEIVVFNSIEENLLSAIIESKLKKLTKQLPVDVKFAPSVVKMIASQCNFREYGVRDVNRIIRRQILSDLADYHEANAWGRNTKLSMSYRNGKPSFKKKKVTPPPPIRRRASRRRNINE